MIKHDSRAEWKEVVSYLAEVRCDGMRWCASSHFATLSVASARHGVVSAQSGLMAMMVCMVLVVCFVMLGV